MTVSRREFLRTGAAAAAGIWSGVNLGALAPVPTPYFGLHPFIERNPKAVFIRRTNVRDKMDAAAKLREGLGLARRDLRADGSARHPHHAPDRPEAQRHRRLRPGAQAGRELGHGHRPAVLRRHGHGAEGTRPEAVPLRRIDALRHLEPPRVQRHQRTARRPHRRVRRAARGICAKASKRTGPRCRTAWCSLASRTTRRWASPTPGCSTSPSGRRTACASPRRSRTCRAWWRTRSPASAVAGGRCWTSEPFMKAEVNPAGGAGRERLLRAPPEEGVRPLRCGRQLARQAGDQPDRARKSGRTRPATT